MDSANEKGTDQSDKAKEAEMSPQNENEEVSPDQVALTEDSSKVTFIPASDTSQNGEAKVELPEIVPQYSGMSKEELMQYVNDPFWIRVRWVMFILFWLIWLGMLVGAIVIIIFAPKCAPPPTTEWYQESPIYEVYTKSFKDSDGNGKGDLKGIENKLDYFEKIGIKTLWLPSIYKNSDDPYAVVDLKSISEEFGTIDDFKSLLTAMKSKGMKLIMDFVPNHSSDKSTWFEKSVANDTDFRDYYVWKGGPNQNDPPNKWVGVDGSPAWTFEPSRKQFYLHQLSANKPDYDLTNTEVITALEEAMEFWLELGVDGFRMTSVNYLYETFTDGADADQNTATLNQPDNFRLLRRFKNLMETYSNSTGDLRVLIVQTVNSGSDEVSKLYYGSEDDRLADLQYNSDLINDMDSKADNIGKLVERSVCKWLDTMPTWSFLSWAFGNADSERVASRFSDDILDALHMISLILPGTPFTYYGDELGMTDFSQRGVQDSESMRTPMQWDSTDFAGFTWSNATPWKAVNPNYVDVNTEVELAAEGSHLGVYKALLKLRSEQASVKFGETKISALSNSTLAFTRSMKGSPAYAVVVNFGANATIVDLGPLNILPKDARVILKSGNKEISQKTVDTTKVTVGGYEGVVLSFVAQHKD